MPVCARPESKRRRFILSEIEHKCVLAAGRVISGQLGFPVDHFPVDKDGRILLASLENALDDDVLAVSVMAVNNEIGTIQDIGKISGLVRQAGALFHCDAAQAPVSMDLRGIADYVDLLSLSAHKMYGPKGIGVLYIRRELQDDLEPLIYGGGQQGGLRSGTVPTPLCVGMGAAAELLSGNEVRQKRVLLRQTPWSLCGKIVGLTVVHTLEWALGRIPSSGQCQYLFRRVLRPGYFAGAPTSSSRVNRIGVYIRYPLSRLTFSRR